MDDDESVNPERMRLVLSRSAVRSTQVHYTMDIMSVRYAPGDGTAARPDGTLMNDSPTVHTDGTHDF